ncbi:restriction endonuclease subunit S [Bernardetia sp. OM2101]|uniref:restriction endonuclease subunit S n=1 Tax=Bernardetia sp. OM2101 TaxID=3344876 RepID=UPI0035CF2B1F
MNMKMDFSKLPKHWKVKKLKEIVRKQTGVKPMHRSPKEKKDISLLEWDVEVLEKGIANIFADWYSTVHCFENDIFVLRTGGRNGLVFKGKKGIAGSTLYCLTPLSVDSDYIFYYLKSKEFEHSGTRDLKPSFWEMKIPIPPIEEQKHIVQSIQEAYQNFETQNQEAEKNLLDSFRRLVSIQSEELEKIEGLVDFCQLVSDFAILGKLTVEFRKANTISDRFEIVKLKELVKSLQYGTSKKSDNEGLVPVLRMGNIQNGKINWNDLKYSSNQLDISKYKLNKGDVLFNRTNSAELVGKTAIFNGEKEAIFAGYLIRVVCNSRINPYYLNICLNGTLSKHYFDSVKITSANQANINAKKLSNLDILLPVIEEQNKIVNLVENIFVAAEQIQNDFEEQKKQQNNLLKSVINAFFQSSSFPNSPTDWDLDVQIKEAREKREKEIKLLKEKQMKKKKEEASKSKLDILSLLEQSEKKIISANDILENSKFKNNIDDFYTEAKELVNEGLIDWKIDEETKNNKTPLSIVTLIEQDNEN